MRILHTVESYTPAVCGMQEVVRQLSERLAAAGHQVTVAAGAHPERREPVINGVRVVSFPLSGNAVLGYQGPVEAYRRFLQESDCEVLVNFAAQQWATDLALPLLAGLRARKVLVPTGFSRLYDPAYAGYFEAMKGRLREYDALVFHSERYRDIEFARACGAGNLRVIPNGAAEDEFLPPVPVDIGSRLGLPADGLLVLLVGSHTGEKGHMEAIKIFQAARLRRATLLVVGRSGSCSRGCRLRSLAQRFSLSALAGGCRVVLADLPRRETVAAYQGADLFLFPSNIECSPIVLFEALAARTPFLVTDVGNAAEVVGWTGGGVLLPTRRRADGISLAEIGGSARLLAALAADRPAREAMAERGFAAWRQRFTWERIAGQYGALYRELLAPGRPAEGRADVPSPDGGGAGRAP